MDRFVLTDAQWAKMEGFVLVSRGSRPERQQHPAVRRSRAVDYPHGQSVAHLPRAFGNWITVYTRFRH
jgi:hypothetical protein